MSKFTFKFKDRMKITVEKVSPRICLFDVSGKHTYSFRLTTKKIKEVVQALKNVVTSNVVEEIELGTPEGYFGTYMLFLNEKEGEIHLVIICSTHIILDTQVTHKFLKRIYKNIKEVCES